MGRTRRFLRHSQATTEEAFVKQALEFWRTRPLRGRGSRAWDVMVAAHLAAQRLKGPLTQGGVKKETKSILEWWKEQCPTDTDFVVPVQNTIRRYVQTYLRYRRGMSKSDKEALPEYLRRVLDDLPSGIHADCLTGLAGALSPAGLMKETTRTKTQIALTRQIRSLKTLK